MHGRECVERRVDLHGYDFREGGLAHSRRSPQDERGDMPRLYHAAEYASLAHEVLLPYVVVERFRAQPFGQRFKHSHILDCYDKVMQSKRLAHKKGKELVILHLEKLIKPY